MRCRKNTVRPLLLRALFAAAIAIALAPIPARGLLASDKELLLKKADEYVLAGKTAQARAAYERAIKAGADLREDYQRSHNLGLSYMNAEPVNMKKAAEWLENAWKLRPETEDNHLQLAQALAWSGDHVAAAMHYRYLATSYPGNSEYLTGWANALAAAGNFDEAAPLYQRIVESNPSNISARLDLARLLSYSRKFSEANLQYRAVLQAEPNNVAAQVGIAKIASWQNDYQTALELFDRILKKHSGNFDAEAGKAFTLLWMGRKDEARTWFRSAASKNPGDREVANALQSLGPVPEKARPAAAITARADGVITVRPATTPATHEREAAKTTAAANPIVSEAPRPTAAEIEARRIADEAALVRSLMEKAEMAAAAGNFIGAVHEYHKVLEHDPGNIGVRLQIARLLSWSKNYAESVNEYGEILRGNPNDLTAQVERARVLSWTQKFDESIAEYKLALSKIEEGKFAVAQGQPAIALSQVRLEYARVLSWNRQYDESLAQFAALLPEGKQPELDDKPILIEKAKVLAYSRRYKQSVETYDAVLRLDPGDYDARLGKAQTIYWSGNLEQAAALMRPLLLQRPENQDANFAMAAVEHGLGYNGRALRHLENAPANGDTRSLRDTIRKELGPMLRFRFGFGNDEEISGGGLSSTLRVLRYSAGVEFSVHPDVRMDVMNTVTDSDTSNVTLRHFGKDSISTETMARLRFRVNPWLQMIAGAGEGNTGGGSVPGLGSSRQQHFIYEVHPIIIRGALRVDIAASRHVADYTPLAVHDNVVNRRESITAFYTFRKRLDLIAEYWHGHYSVNIPDPALARRTFDTNSNGGSLAVTPILYQSDRFRVDAGMRYDSFTFDDGAEAIGNAVNGPGSGGFFAPRVLQRYAGTGHLSWTPTPRLNADVHGTYGPQRIFGFATLFPPPASWGNTGSVGAQLTGRIRNWEAYAAYDYFTTDTAAFPTLRGGSYRSHAFAFGLNIRF